MAFVIVVVPVRVDEVNDVRKRRMSDIVDKAGRLPNINDNSRGKAPDIGAYEAGQKLPIYGPRPKGE